MPAHHSQTESFDARTHILATGGQEEPESLLAETAAHVALDELGRQPDRAAAVRDHGLHA
jgi:hypothetical protein